MEDVDYPPWSVRDCHVYQTRGSDEAVAREVFKVQVMSVRGVQGGPVN